MAVKDYQEYLMVMTLSQWRILKNVGIMVMAAEEYFSKYSVRSGKSSQVNGCINSGCLQEH